MKIHQKTERKQMNQKSAVKDDVKNIVFVLFVVSVI